MGMFSASKDTLFMVNRGKIVIVGIVGVALAAAAFSTWYHHRNQNHALEFWGTSTAVLIAEAPEVELKQLAAEPGVSDEAASTEGEDEAAPAQAKVEFGGLEWKVAADKPGLSAKGITNVRRALVLDTTFDWKTVPTDDDPSWQYALAVTDNKNWATVLFDFDSRKVALTGGKKVALLDPEANEDFRQFFAEQFSAANEREPADQTPAATR